MKLNKLQSQHYGLSLIELMIAISLSSIILLGVGQIFIGSKQTYQTGEALSRVSENLRFALEIITQDISRGGFWGCNPGFDDRGLDGISTAVNDGAGNITINHDANDITIFNRLDPAAATNFIDFRPDGPTGTGGGVFGIDGDAGLNVAPDTITVRGLFGPPIAVQSIASANAPIVLANPDPTLLVDAIVGIADCQHTDFFKITANVGNRISHAAATGAAPQNIDGRVTENYGENGGNIALYRAGQVTYNLQNGANNRPALFRNFNNTLAAANRELISDVDNFQIRYGLDINADGVVDSLVDAGPGIDFTRAISARITLTLSSPTDNVTPNVNPAPFADRRLRRTVVTTIALRTQLP